MNPQDADLVGNGGKSPKSLGVETLLQRL